MNIISLKNVAAYDVYLQSGPIHVPNVMEGTRTSWRFVEFVEELLVS